MKNIIVTIFFLTSVSFCYSQTTGYGYVPRNTQSSQVNYAKVGEDANKMLQNYLVERERKLKELGWASAAEYDAYQKMLKKQKKLKSEGLSLDSSQEQTLTFSDNQIKALDSSTTLLRKNQEAMKSSKPRLTKDELLSL